MHVMDFIGEQSENYRSFASVAALGPLHFLSYLNINKAKRQKPFSICLAITCIMKEALKNQGWSAPF